MPARRRVALSLRALPSFFRSSVTCVIFTAHYLLSSYAHQSSVGGVLRWWIQYIYFEMSDDVSVVGMLVAVTSSSMLLSRSRRLAVYAWCVAVSTDNCVWCCPILLLYGRRTRTTRFVSQCGELTQKHTDTYEGMCDDTRVAFFFLGHRTVRREFSFHLS